MDSIQCFHKHIFNLITLINNLANIKKKKSHGDANYFQFYVVVVVHALNERPSGEQRLSTETR